MKPSDWVLLLNQYVFLFPRDVTETAVYQTYRGEPVIVLMLSSASLITAHREAVRLAAINTGYLMRRPALRGRETFQVLDTFDRPLSAVQEVVVEGGITDLYHHLLTAERHLPDGRVERLRV